MCEVEEKDVDGGDFEREKKNKREKKDLGKEEQM